MAHPQSPERALIDIIAQNKESYALPLGEWLTQGPWRLLGRLAAAGSVTLHPDVLDADGHAISPDELSRRYEQWDDARNDSITAELLGDRLNETSDDTLWGLNVVLASPRDRNQRLITRGLTAGQKASLHRLVFRAQEARDMEKRLPSTGE